MIFPYYLTPEGTELLELIAKAHFKIRENISWCSNKGYAGAIIKDTKTFFICTKNIFEEKNPNTYLNETLKLFVYRTTKISLITSTAF